MRAASPLLIAAGTTLLIAVCATPGCAKSGTSPGFGDGDGGVGLFGDDGSGQSLGCSPDLQNVIDASGNIVQMCPPGQGCAGGKCVAACDAAGASHGNVGCDFVVATPSFYQGVLQGQYA